MTDQADSDTHREPVAFLRRTIHLAIAELMDRVAVRDDAVDAEAERQKIAFLVEADGTHP